MSLPLAGVLVADFSRVLAGPLAAATLADLGADVIKVERPGVGDDTRHWGPPWTATSSSYFECANRSKQSVELDLDDPADLRLAQELAAPVRRADRELPHRDARASRPRLRRRGGAEPGRRLRLDHRLRQRCGREPPRLRLPDPGGGRPDEHHRSADEPTKVGVALVDVLTSKDAVVAVLAALRARETAGTGQHVEVNLLSSLLGSLANQASAYLTTGRAPAPMGNQHPSIAPYETLAAKDGHLAVCCGNDGQFRRLVAVLGAASAADDPRFETNAAAGRQPRRRW